jgi:hypothetical protein
MELAAFAAAVTIARLSPPNILSQEEMDSGCRSTPGIAISIASTDQLVEAIEAFIAAYNQSASPFVWRKREVKGSQLRNTTVNLRN